MRFGGPDEARWLYQTVLPKLRRLIPKQALWGESFDKAWQEKRHILQFKDGSSWDFLTYNMELNAWAGSDLDRVSFDEEPKGRHGEDIHEECVGRLADRNGHFRYTLTPVEGIGWLYYLLSDEKGDPRKDDEVFVIRGAIDHNPHVSEKGKKQAIKEWHRRDPMRVEARRFGRWVHLEGLIFPEFKRLPEEEGGHICADRDPPQGATIIAVFDPGIDDDHPFALHLAFIDPEDKGYEVFHTHRIYGSPADEMADHYHETLAVFGIPKSRPRRLIDPSARNRKADTGRSMQWYLQRRGINTRPGKNDRMISYSEIKFRLKNRHEGTGRPLLRIQARCDGDLGDEMVNYRWKKPRTRTDQEPTQKAEPVKIKDDLIDTVRYGVMDVRLTDSHERESEPEDDPTANGAMRRRIKALASRRKRGKVGGVW
jgi:phage terminase large subunit-like protein